MSSTQLEPKSADRAEIAHLLRETRIAVGYSLDDMSLVTGLTTNEIADVERGVISRSTNLERLREATAKLRR